MWILGIQPQVLILVLQSLSGSKHLSTALSFVIWMAHAIDNVCVSSVTISPPLSACSPTGGGEGDRTDRQQQLFSLVEL